MQERRCTEEKDKAFDLVKDQIASLSSDVNALHFPNFIESAKHILHQAFELYDLNTQFYELVREYYKE